MLNYVTQRLNEPSTWAALATILALGHVNVDPGLWKNVMAAGAGLGGIVAFFLPEKKAG